VERQKPVLVIFSGLPGTGKTTLAKEISHYLGATHIRIDTIEQALRRSMLKIDRVEDAGYEIGYALAKDNLLLGNTVVADSVNPIEITREAWLLVAQEVGCASVEVEIICSDSHEHQNRVETRHADIVGHTQPNWNEVVTREYHAWKRTHLVIDTANKSVEGSKQELLNQLSAYFQKKP
jgi:predicted kinase